MNVLEFQAKWRGSILKESASAKEHFLDLVHDAVFGHVTDDREIVGFSGQFAPL